jgi:lipoprotein-releasing system permease protein
LRLDDWRRVITVIRREPGVVAAAPEVISQAGITAGEDYGEGVNLVGFDPDTGTRSITSLPKSLVKGDLRFKTDKPGVDGGILLGSRLASRLSVFPGDVVTLVPVTEAKVNRALGVAVPRFWKFEVTGLFETGMFQYDNQFVVMSLAAAQRFTGLGDAVSGIGVRLADPNQAPQVGEALEKRLGYPYRALDWQTQNSSLFSALQLEKLAMGLIIFFIMVVAAFNIVGTLTMVVNDKTREIGILRAMGLTSPAVARVFLLQGAVIGLVGTAIGLIVGLTTAYVVDRSGWVRINPAVYFIDHLPVHVELFDVLVVVLASLAVAVLATLYPSRSAAALTPVEAIRHDLTRFSWRWASVRATGGAPAPRSRSCPVSTCRSLGASSSPSWARAARERARSCICWGRWTHPPRGPCASTAGPTGSSGRSSWPRSAIASWGSCSSSTICSGSSARWRTS